MPAVYFSLGANLGDRHANLDRAIEALSGLVDVTDVSPIYETPPWGPIPDQPDYLNMCVAGVTDLSPQCLLVALGNLEKRIGRKNHDRWGPHAIDVDLLFYDDVVMSYGGDHIPKRQIEQRAFVLVPLNDIAPDVVHPELKLTVWEMLAAVDGAEDFRRVVEDEPELVMA